MVAGTVDEQPAHLHYSQRNPKLTKRRVGWIIVAALLIGAIVFVSIWGDSLKRRYVAWERQRSLNALQLKCMAFSAPADQVVYEEDPASLARLKSDANYQAIAVNMTAQTNSLSATTMPFGLPAPMIRISKTWTDYQTFNAPYPHSFGLAFMHERTSAAGVRQLVCVASAMEVRQTVQTNWGTGGDWGTIRALYAWSIKPGSPQTLDDVPPSGMLYFSSPDEIEGIAQFRADPAQRFPAPFPLRLYAGQIDPTNTARFTVDYELLGIGHRGTITGELQDDGTVRLRPDCGAFPKIGSNISWNVPTTKPAVLR